MQQYPEYLLWNRRKTLTGSPDPTRANRPCKKVSLTDYNLVRICIISAKSVVKHADGS